MPQYQGIWNLAQQAQAVVSQQWGTDPLFDYTTLLLQGDNVSGSSQNNVFVDSSTNNFLITRNGNTTQGAFSPFSATGWSSFLPGTTTPSASAGDYYIGSTNLWNTNTSTFTVDGWIYPTSYSTTFGLILGDNNPTGAELSIGVYLSPTGKIALYWYDGNSKTCTGSTTVPLNQWSYFAVRVSSNAISIYVNSSTADTLTGTTTLTDRTQTPNFCIGVYNGSTNNSYKGYISNLRMSTIARTITVPTAPFVADADTKLLTLQSNRVVDNSLTPLVITQIAAPSVQAFSPFAPQFQYSPTVTGGSGYFDGDGDYLVAPSTTQAAFAWGTGDYSIECWVYLPTTTTYTRFITSSTAANGAIDMAATSLALNYFDGTSYSLGTMVCNQWMHLAITRKSGTIRTFQNGVLRANGANTTNANTNVNFGIGATATGAQAGNAKYITGIRMVKGGIPSAYDTASTTNGTQIFTPPTQAFTGSESLTAGSVSLLMNFTNAGILDGTMKNNLETVGNAQISTSVVKYGSGSMYFDGTDDRLFIPTVSQNQAMGTGDWTVEFWFCSTITTFSNWRIMLDFRPNTTNGAYMTFSINSAAKPVFYAAAAERIIGDAIVSNQWYHMAVVKSSGSTKMYINGVQVGSTYADTNSYLDSGRILVGGGGYTLGTEMFLGYIDDLRITRGIARYTRNFTPPQVALPRQ